MADDVPTMSRVSHRHAAEVPAQGALQLPAHHLQPHRLGSNSRAASGPTSESKARTAWALWAEARSSKSISADTCENVASTTLQITWKPSQALALTASERSPMQVSTGESSALRLA
jgi:hypothetical protein